MKLFLFSIHEGQPLRDWSRSLTTLSKISEYLNFHVHELGVTLQVINNAKSAVGQISFSRNEFFDKFTIAGETPGETLTKLSNAAAFQPINDNHRTNFTFKLNSKFFVLIFKRHERDQSVEKCEVYFEEPRNNESRLVAIMHCHHGIKKTYKLSYEESRPFKFLHNAEDYSHSFEIPASAIKQYIDHTSYKAEEFSMTFANDESITLTGFSEGISHNAEVIKNPLKTSINIEADMFESVAVGRETSVTFSLKDFRALVGLADTFQTTIEASFGEPRQPIVFCFNRNSIETKFVLFTGDPYGHTPYPSSSRLPLISKNRAIASEVEPSSYSQKVDFIFQKDNSAAEFSASNPDESIPSQQSEKIPEENAFNNESQSNERNVSRLPIKEPHPPHLPLQPILPKLDFTSPFTVRGQRPVHDDFEPHVSQETEQIVWNQNNNAPSLKLILKGLDEERMAKRKESETQIEQDSLLGKSRRRGSFSEYQGNDRQFAEEVALFADSSDNSEDEQNIPIGPSQIDPRARALW
ncbi:Rad9-domain-containing protein [Lipomyces japonicus]|uniref:Rad9-domain-containing protein n=1 Tax=Lipomyces japonicus TaxID=56871 RepID=UPI0034D001DC